MEPRFEFTHIQHDNRMGTDCEKGGSTLKGGGRVQERTWASMCHESRGGYPGAERD